MKEFFWCVEYLASFIEIFMCCYFCGTFIVKEEISGAKNKVLLLSFITSTVTILLNTVQLFSYFTTVIVILCSIIIQWICYHKKYLLSIGLVAVYMAIISAIDSMIVYLTALILNTDIGYIVTEQNFVRMICILLSKCILIIFVVTLHRVIVDKKVIPYVYIIIMGICSVFLIISNLVLIDSELNKSNEEINGFTMTFFIATLGIEMIVFFLIYKVADGYEQKQVNQLIELNNKMLQKSLDETEQTFALWRQSIHDYKNHIIALKQLAEDGKMEEIRSYLKKENALIEQKMFYIKTGNSTVDAIINTKQSTAEKKDIEFMVHAEFSHDIAISDIDMANILGNLIDNAIEAEEKEDAPYIEITIKEEKNFLIINIRNKCTKQMSDNLKTSKKDSQFHGIGLKSVRRIVKKYDGEISVNTENQEFIVNILIQNKSK